MTRSEDSEKSISIPSASWLKSSTTFSTRLLPSVGKLIAYEVHRPYSVGAGRYHQLLWRLPVQSSSGLILKFNRARIRAGTTRLRFQPQPLMLCNLGHIPVACLADTERLAGRIDTARSCTARWAISRCRYPKWPHHFFFGRLNTISVLSFSSRVHLVV